MVYVSINGTGGQVFVRPGYLARLPDPAEENSGTGHELCG